MAVPGDRTRAVRAPRPRINASATTFQPSPEALCK